MIREDLPARSVERGAQFMAGLRGQQARYPEVIKEVRGLGLMIGIELQSEAIMAILVDEVHKEHLIIGDSINSDVTARLEPPLTITAGQVDEALTRLERAVAATARHLA